MALADRLRLAREIAKLVKARLPLEKALGILAQQATGSYAQAVEIVQRKLEQGQSLVDALAPGSDPSARMLAATLQLGELSGSIDQSLDHWATYNLTLQRQTRRIASAIVYPVLLALIALVSILYSAWKLLPQYQTAFAELAPSRSDWHYLIELSNRYYGFVATAIALSTLALMWRCFAVRPTRDADGVPRGQATHYLYHSHVARLCALGVQSGQPLTNWLAIASQAVGLTRPELPTPEAADTWSHQLGKETSAVLLGLHAGHLNPGDAQALLNSIADNSAIQAEVEVERQVHRIPVITSVVVGTISIATYVGLIYLPWIALYYHIAKDS